MTKAGSELDNRTHAKLNLMLRGANASELAAFELLAKADLEELINPESEL